MAMYQVRILRDGKVQTVAHVEDLDVAHEWAYTEMRLRRDADQEPTKLWGALVSSGRLFVDDLGDAKDLFSPDDQLTEGLVLDKRMLKDPEISIEHLFGLKPGSWGW